MRRKILLILIVLPLAAAGIFYWVTRPLPVLTVTTWPGAYGRAQAAALMRPYAASRRVDVHLAEYDGGLADLSKAVTSHAYQGDVIDFELPDAIQACRQGLLEKIDPASLPPGDDGVPAAKDFVPGAIGPCWVGSIVYSQAIIFGNFAGPQPQTLADFFDIAKFPGRRALRHGAKYNLEMALLADGVAAKDVYPTLASEAGVARALKKLESLGPIVWWDASSMAVALVKTGGAAMATALNQDIYDARLSHVIWDKQLYELDVFGVPAGDPKKDTALDFVRFATGSSPLAGVASWVPHGPARRSALALVGDNPELHTPMKPWLPTAHFDTAFAIDDAWWLAHGPALAARFDAWAQSH